MKKLKNQILDSCQKSHARLIFWSGPIEIRNIVYFDFLNFSCCRQCDQICANFRHFGKSLQVFGKFLTVFSLFGKMLKLLWQFCDIIVSIFFAANGQILKNNLTIRSHWLQRNAKVGQFYNCLHFIIQQQIAPTYSCLTGTRRQKGWWFIGPIS